MYPLTNVKSISSKDVKIIIEERKNGKFKDIFDFVSRCYKETITSETIKSLILSGAFDCFNISRKTLIDNIEVITNYGEIGTYLNDDAFKPQLDNTGEYSKEELMEFELNLFGFYLTNHPVTEYKRKMSYIELKNISDYFDKQIETVIYVDKVRQIVTKNKEQMMFITGSDELSKIDIVIFPKIYKGIKSVNIGDIVSIKGKVTKRFDEYQVIANQIVKLN